MILYLSTGKGMLRSTTPNKRGNVRRLWNATHSGHCTRVVYLPLYYQWLDPKQLGQMIVDTVRFWRNIPTIIKHQKNNRGMPHMRNNSPHYQQAKMDQDGTCPIRHALYLIINIKIILSTTQRLPG